MIIEKSTSEPEDFLYTSVVNFNSIYVIESLAQGELKTGRDLFEGVIYPAASRLGDIHAEFASVNTKEQLLNLLAQVAYAAQTANHNPIVHIEAHGGPDGILLADGTRVAWQDLVPAFIDINVACHNNLIVVAVSCFGWNLTASLMPSDRAPVFMLIGPLEPMSAGDLLDATRLFYEALMAMPDVNSALQVMNAPHAFSEWPIRLGTAEILYCRVFRTYIEEHASPDVLRKRENDLVAKITRARSLNLLQSAELRAQARHDLADHQTAYYRHRHKFLMLDLYPEDSARFGLTYEMCIPTETRRSPSTGA